MKLNKNFKEKFLLPISKINEFCIQHGKIIPDDYIEFLMKKGGKYLVQGKSEIYVSKTKKEDDFIFYSFWGLDDLNAEIDILDFKGDKFNHIPLSKYFWIGEGSGQNYLAIGNTPENYNQIFWYEDQELEVHFISQNLETFINEHIVEKI